MLIKVFKDGREIGKYDSVIEKLANQYNCPKWHFYADAFLCRIRNGIQPHYYFSLMMYRLNQKERKQYVNARKLTKLEKVFNTNKDKDAIINDKCGFNARFAKYMKRDWMYGPDHADEEIRAFLQQNDAIMIKPPETNMGIGVEKVVCADALQDFPAFVEKVKREKLLMEGFIRQHEEMSALNPTSVNTIRVVSVRDASGKVHIIATSLRVGGAGQVVDNFKANGVQYPVDPVTGIVIGGGVMHNGTRNVYFHPSTNKQVIGFRIPNWDSVISTVTEAAKIPENIRYIGWDMAITPEDCDIVEANINQGSNGMQLDGVGKYRIIMQYL